MTELFRSGRDGRGVLRKEDHGVVLLQLNHKLFQRDANWTVPPRRARVYAPTFATDSRHGLRDSAKVLLSFVRNFMDVVEYRRSATLYFFLGFNHR